MDFVPVSSEGTVNLPVHFLWLTWQGGHRCVWISHIHADHHAGLPRLLSVRQKYMGDAANPVLVIGPPALRKTLLRFNQIDPISYTYLIANSVATMDHDGLELKWNMDKVRKLK